MNVLVFAPFGVAEYHFDTDLEIAQQHLEEGDRVTIAVCNADLLTCEVNAEHDLGRCLRCVGRHIEGIGRLTPKPEVVDFVRLSPADRAEICALDVSTLRTLEDLRGLRVDNFDIGWAVASSLITHFRGAQFDLIEQRPRIQLALSSAMAVYRSMQRLLQDLKIDRVYAFNGRFATMRAVLRAAQKVSVDCYIHERGSTFEKYSLFENHLPHDLDYYQGRIRETWSAADPELREAIGASFYADRLTGIIGSWISFSGQQKSGLLPEGWKERPNNVAVYTTSTDEIEALADVMTGSIYLHQYDGLEQIFQAFKEDTSTHFYVRLHPRTHLFPDAGSDRLKSLDLKNVTVIAGGSSVSTYALMRKATRVLTFGSTTGIEAVHWGVPSILGARSFYDALGSTYNPGTHEEMLHLLSTNLAPNDKLGAMMYGYFEKTVGVPYRFFRPTGLTGGSFGASPIKPSVAFRTAGWLVDHAGARDLRNRVYLKISQQRLLAS